MEQKAKRPALNLSDTEYSNIDEYRKKKNTAVLTIMFTDIQGFTALTENKGETYVHELHSQHDKILVETIEEDNAGMVIKYIGDSIMAVFAEPTAAAEKSLKIQRRLHAFNKEHPELDDIKVRIGLHMGQTVIENKIQTDLFGRHVNKASRVESLAAGGHVFISYPVFDSVKSWLMDAEHAASKLHGSYYLKGIDKAEEIYEIYNADITRPQAPKKARKKNGLSPVIPVSIAAALIGIAGIIFMMHQLGPETARTDIAAQDSTEKNTPAETVAAEKPAEKPAVTPAKTEAAPVRIPEVFFLGMSAREPILDFDTPLAVTLENEAQGLKKSVNDILPGKHIIHYVVSYMVRYYAEINVKPGKNVIQVAFRQSYLPNVDVHYSVSDDTPASAADEESYFLFDHKTLEKITYQGKVSAEVKGVKSSDTAATFDIHYAIVVNGKTIADAIMKVESPLKQDDWTSVDQKILYEDTDQYYFYKYSFKNESLQFSVGCSFKD